MYTDSRVYLCDTFKGIVKADVKYDWHKDGDFKETSVELVSNYLNSLSLSNYTILEGVFPEETGVFTLHQLFKLVHIDVDVYNSGKDCLEFLWDKIVVGGIIVFDDYDCETTKGITTYVREMKKKYNVRQYGSDQGTFIKVA